MTEDMSFMPRIEVAGEAVRAFLEAFPPELRPVGLRVLAAHGIEDPGQDKYYPLQAFLGAMKEVSENYGSQMLFRIGSEIARNAKLPPGIDILENCLTALDTAYRMNHRGGTVGSYDFVMKEKTGVMNVGSMICANPYPCSFDWGVIEGFAQRFKPPGSIDIIVRHDDSKPCRKQGARSCAYFVTWV